MLRYNAVRNLSAERFQRMVGISFQKFHYLLEKLTEEVEHRKANYPMSKRGLSSAISLNDKLLLTLYYIRHYTTFETVSCVFGVSESYANKIYHRISSILLSVIHVKGIKALSQSDIDGIIIDASEQTIERPLKRQKDYYSGKKTAHCKSPAYCG